MISFSFLRGTESFLHTYFLKKKELACLTQLLLPLPPKLSQYHHPIYIAFGTVIRFSASFRAVLPVGEHGPPRAGTGEVAVGVQGLPKSGPQVVGILQARHGRSGKQEQGQNSPNLETTLFVSV